MCLSMRTIYLTTVGLFSSALFWVMPYLNDVIIFIYNDKTPEFLAMVSLYHKRVIHIIDVLITP